MKYLLDDISTYKENKSKTFVSLNEQKRKIEKEKKDQKEFERTGSKQDSIRTELLDGEIPVTNKVKNDFILDETARILSDLITLTIG